MNQDRTYSNKARELLEDARQIDWTAWENDSEGLARDVSAVMLFISHLSRLDAQLLNLYRLKKEMQEMSFEDYVMDKQIVDCLKMMRRRWGKIQNIILTYTNRQSDDITQDDEFTLGEELDPCGYDHLVKSANKSLQNFCKERLHTFIALEPLLRHYRAIAMDSMIRMVEEGREFASLCKKQYEEWLRQNRPSIERRLKNGLYKSSLYGKTIIPLQSTPPGREHWGEALGLKMQQIREDSIYSFIDDDAFHEVGRPIKLTSRLLITALNSIKRCSPSNAEENVSYEKQMKVFYGHIAEINILKEKIAFSTSSISENIGYPMNTEENDEQSVYPAMTLLERLVRVAIKEKKRPKYILMPVRAAREAGVPIPINDVKGMNKHFGTELTRQNWSQWVNGTAQSSYDPKEMDPMISQFKKLV
ncbi:MAG: hypothetical protein IJP75_11430 [Bacteroidaceae bacterium]|nr:hypothetical protein [Bacteroidaceae bacterium]